MVKFTSLLALLLLGFSVHSLFAEMPSGIRPCSPQTPIQELCRVKVHRLRPTQFAIGQIEVEKKKRKLRKKDEDDLNDYLKDHPEPMVVGPKGEFYITDHHHLGRALYENNVEETYGTITANFANLSSNEFWQKMERKKWVYLYDEGGRGPMAHSQLPMTVADLRDDVYRSLAGEVLDQDGFEKTDIPFAEFQWANFFRSRISKSILDNEFEQAVRMGLKLATSREARHLPGYKGKDDDRD